MHFRIKSTLSVVLKVRFAIARPGLEAQLIFLLNRLSAMDDCRNTIEKCRAARSRFRLLGLRMEKLGSSKASSNYNDDDAPLLKSTFSEPTVPMG